MDVKDAVAQAKQHVTELFSDEGIQNLGLKEVDHDDIRGIWNITLGFSRPWDQPHGALAAIAGQTAYARRAFEVVQIHEGTGRVLSVKSRDIAE